MAFVAPFPLTATRTAVASHARVRRHAPATRPQRTVHRGLTSMTAATSAPASVDAPVATFDWMNQWYPVHFTVDIEPDKAYAITLWNRDLVLYKDSASPVADTYVVTDDSCPHRAAPLSEGRVYTRRDPTTSARETILECGYHGWRFNCAGTCVDVPTIPIDGPIRRSADLPRVYPVSVVGGAIFVWPGDDVAQSQRVAPPVPDEFRSDSVFTTAPYRRIFPYDVATLAENVADPAHLSWAHHGSAGKRQNTRRNGGIRMLSTDFLRGVFDAESFYGDVPVVHMQFAAPSLITARSLRGKVKVSIAFFVVPMRPDESLLMLMTAFGRPPAILRLLTAVRPRWKRCADGHDISDGDAYMLRVQHERLRNIAADPGLSAWRQEYGLAHAEWDTLLIAVRRFYVRHAGTTPLDWRAAWERLGATRPSVSPRDVMDRYATHTVHCLACSRTLTFARRAKIVYAAVAVLAVVALLADAVAVACWRAAPAKDPKIAPVLRTTAVVAAGVLLVVSLLLRAAMSKVAQLTYTTVAYDKARAH